MTAYILLVLLVNLNLQLLSLEALVLGGALYIILVVFAALVTGFGMALMAHWLWLVFQRYALGRRDVRIP
jgi:hypothetical protein